MSLDKVILNASKKDFVGFKKYLEAVMNDKIKGQTSTIVDKFQKGVFSEKISDKDKEYDIVEPNTHIDDDELDDDLDEQFGKDDDKKGDKEEKDNAKKKDKKDKVDEEEDADGEDSEDDKED